VLEEKKDVVGYEKTRIWSSVEEFQGESPDAVFIGTPPAFRGTMIEGRNIEVAIAEKFPSAALFVEKPISSALPEDVVSLIPYFEDKGTFVAVGYMLRYLKGRFPVQEHQTSELTIVIQKMKSIIKENGIIVASTNAWYQSTYASEDKGMDRQGQ